MKARLRTLSLLALIPVVFAASRLAFGSTVTVTAANPNAAAPGTVNLNVAISGSGYKRGAAAKFFITGTTDPGGVTVTTTTFSSSSQVLATISVDANATIASYDIDVQNTDGSSGKGTELFAVNQNSASANCTTFGTPSGFTLAGVLNPVQANGAPLITTGRLGNAIRVRPVDLNGDGVPDALVALVTSGDAGGTEGLYIFLLDPNNGTPLAANPITGVAWQNPILLLTGVTGNHLEVGDVNGDGVPDFIFGVTNSSGAVAAAHLFVGSVGNNTLTYTDYTIPPPPSAGSAFGSSVAIGDLDGDGLDEVVVGDHTGGSKNRPLSPAVYIYKFGAGSGTTLVKTITDPSGSTSSSFGNSAAIGNVTGDADKNLVVGAPNAGLVYVFHAPVLTQTSYFTLSEAGTNLGTDFGWGLEIADVDHDSTIIRDLIVTNRGSSQLAAMLFPGPLSSTTPLTSSMQPSGVLTSGWDQPNMDVGNLGTVGAVAVGAPNTTNSTSSPSCDQVGAVHLFVGPFSAVQPTNYVFEPPAITSGSMEFGWGVAIANGYPFLFIGEHLQTVGNMTYAGQVYVYKMN